MQKIELPVSDEQMRLYEELGGVNWLRWHVSPMVSLEERKVGDRVRAWILERCLIGEDLFVSSAKAYSDYCAWRVQTNMTHKTFALRVLALGFIHGKRCGERGYRGLALK